MTEMTPLLIIFPRKFAQTIYTDNFTCIDMLLARKAQTIFYLHRYGISSQGTDNITCIGTLFYSPKNAIYSLSNVIYQTTGYFTTTKDVEWTAVDKFWNFFPDPFGMQF